MGQRLVINICKNNNIIGSAYYHWSAYTDSACHLVNLALDALYEMESNELLTTYSDIEIVTEMLYPTGAGLTNEAIKAYGEQLGYFEPALDRNNGLIALTKEGIAELNTYAESVVYINLDNEQILFDVCWCEGDREHYGEVLEGYGIDNYPTADQIPLVQCEMDNISFNYFYEFSQIVEDQSYFITPAGCVYSTI